MKGDLRRKGLRRAAAVLESDEVVRTDEKGADGSDENGGDWSGLRVNWTGKHSRHSRKTLLEGAAGQDSWWTTWAQ
jgi:hypothetical protein